MQRVASKLGASRGLIYLVGQRKNNIEDTDQAKSWRQRRYFYYCSGVDEPDCFLTYDVENDYIVLYVPEIVPERVVWEGRGSTIEEAMQRYDVDDARLTTRLTGDIKSWLHCNQDATFFLLHPDQKPNVELSKIDDELLILAMDYCRLVKDPHEIQLIRRANVISGLAHRAVLENIREFSNEAQVQGIFEDTCISLLAKKQAYAIIAGSGKNAGVLHYTKNDEPLGGRQLLCLDAGAEHANYASDVTRTFPISGSWTSEAKAIYEVVQEMQESCIKLLQPGVRMYDLHVHSHMVAIEGLLRLGILRGASKEEIYAAGTSKGFYPHGLGHHLGLDVHDVINSPVLRYSNGDKQPQNHKTVPYFVPQQPQLEAGMIVTIEPGIYFNRFELERAYLYSPKHSKYIDQAVLDRYWEVGGVRIEDDLLITHNGYENLTTAPKGEEALAIILKDKTCG